MQDHKNILVAAQHLLSLIQDVLDLSRIEVGDIEVRREEIDVVDLFAQVESMIRGSIESQGNTLAFEIDVEPSTRIRSDHTKIRQILINLLHNANKFTERGTIRLGARCLPAPDRLVMEVTDTGIGITPEVLPTVMDAFTQEHHRDPVRGAGVGLGLSIVKGLVEALGGEVEVQSSLGEGTSFRVQLPFASGA